MIVACSGAGVLAAACHTAQPRAAETTAMRAERTVFTDSAMHADLCVPTKPGENWRTVCVPKDQSVRPVRKP